MDLTSGTLITLKDKKYIIIENLVYNNNNYAFTNEVIGEEELTENYYIFQIVDNEVRLITNEELINDLLPKFQEKLKNTIEEFL